MQFQNKILLISFALSILVSCIIVPMLRRLKLGQIVREEGPRSHLKKQGTPTMGGLIMVIVICIMTLYCYNDYKNNDMLEVASNLLPLLFVTVGFGLVGFVDDFKKLVLKNTKGLSPKSKMLGLLIVSVVYTLVLLNYCNIGTEVLIPFTNNSITLPTIIYIVFAIFVMLGTTNAINLTDGVDGLATSITSIIIACLTVVSIMIGTTEITVFGSLLVGACLGFLLFNLHPAKVFMGDTGSLMLGGAIAGIALYLKMPLLLLIIAIIPIIETISVMMQVMYFKKTGNRIFKMTPIHHHYELSGWGENKIVSVFSIITLIFSILGLMSV